MRVAANNVVQRVPGTGKAREIEGPPVLPPKVADTGRPPVALTGPGLRRTIRALAGHAGPALRMLPSKQVQASSQGTFSAELA